MKSCNFTERQSTSVWLMKNLKIFVMLVFVVLAIGQRAWGQTNGDYQTRTSVTGNWNGTATWQKYALGAWGDVTTSPTSSDGVITIRSGAIVTITASVSVDQVTIDAGGKVILSGGTLTVANGADIFDLIINGIYERTSTSTTMTTTGVIYCGDGGRYKHTLTGGSLPTITWNANSTLQIDGGLNSGELSQSFGNIEHNSGSTSIQNSTIDIQTGAIFRVTGGTVTFLFNLASSISDTWNGDLRISGGIFNVNGATVNYNASLTVNNLIVDGGSLYVNNNARSSDGTDATLTVNGDLTFSNGTIDIYHSANSSSNSQSDLSIKGNFTWSGGTLQRTNSELSGPYTTIDFVGTSGIQTLTQTLGSALFSQAGRGIAWSETGASTVDQTYIGTTGILRGLASPSGNFTINCSGTATTAASSTTTINGVFYMTQGTFALGSSATLAWGASGQLNYNGTAAQTTGPEWPTSFNKPVTISNTSGVVTIGTATFTGTSATTTINTGATLATGAGTFTAAGPMAINGAFQINQSGNANGAVAWTYGPAGTLIYNNSTGPYGAIDNSHLYWPTTNGPFNVTVQNGGGINMGVARTVTGKFLLVTGSDAVQGTALTLNGTVQINGGNFKTVPTYGPSSTLIYNTTYGTSNEWTGGAFNTVSAGSGIPANVTVQTGTLTLGGGRGVPGNVTVQSVAGLVLNATSGDLYIGGNLVNNGSTWTNNTRAVFFVLGNTQTITSSSGTQYFDYLVLDKSAGSVQLASTDVTINTTAGSVLQLINTGGLDLNGRSLTLTGNGGNILTSGSARSINATGSGNFNIQGTKTVTSTSGGSLVFASTVTVKSSGANVHFGSSLTTINGTLELLGGSVALGGAPIYGTSSLLKYNTGTNYGAYEEWYANNTGFVAGVPQNVTIASGTSLNFGSSNAYRQMRGDLSFSNPVTSTSTLALSSVSGGDLYIGGNWNKSAGGTFAPNGRLVKFNGTNNQTITASGGETFAYLEVNNSDGVELANNVTVNSTLTLTNGNLSGTGTLTYGTNGILKYNGTSYSTTGNVEFPAASGPESLNITNADAAGITLHANRTIAGNMTIATEKKFIIPADKQFTVNGTITNDATAAGFVVKSGGSLIQNSAVSATVERDISAWGAPSIDHGWHFLSSPVSEQAIDPSFTNTPETNYDFYCWWEPSNVWVNFKNAVDPTWNIANTSTNFNVGKGYLVEYAATSTKQFAGILNNASIPVTGLAISTGANRGWHLLGNPFTSAIKWNDGHWAMTNIAAGAKIWNEGIASYSDISAYEIIPALNGFMVQVTSGTGSLTIPTAARVHDATGWYKSAESPSILLIANDLDNLTAQESVIRFDNMATTGYDSDFDSHFLSGYAPQFYSTAGSEQFSTNTLPEAGGTVQIPFSFIKNNGTRFTVQAKTISNLFGPIILNDLKTNATQDLTVNPVYSFTSASEDNPSRFLITFSHLGLGDNKTDNSFTVSSSGSSILVNDNTGKNTGNVYVYNLMGQLVATSTLNANTPCKLNVNVPVGYYLVKVISSEQAYSTKIFINQR